VSKRNVALLTKEMRFQLLHHTTLDSTNREAADQARKGAAEGLTIVADEQTAGRGRQGRTWISQKESGAYFSTILRPRIEPRYYTLVPLMAAVATYDALLKGWSIHPDIKWPNDILVDEKKIAGILAEMIDTPAGNAIILGIGINVRDPDPELNATSIEAESQLAAKRDDVIASVHDQISAHYATLLTDPKRTLEEWSRRSSYFDGKDVTVDLGNGNTFTGTTCGLEENGALRVRVSGGSVRTVQAGDVMRLRKA
jgi:BirA family biotin operon repressor/biotin-[acetyl-CoA-carboxylase] ligase